MTTTSSFAFSTMEVPSMDDTMEMASPYQGHADDFEIDIDVMEDQASNPDRDMTASDEYMDNSQGANYGHQGSPDEDMIDDTVEPSMIDADEYPETNQNIEMQYDEEKKTYEAEMLEDDYDEDIDAPVPEHEQEANKSHQDANSQEASRANPPGPDKELHEDEEKSPFESRPEIGTEHLDKSQPESQPDFEQAVDSQDGQQPADESETARLDPGHTTEAVNSTNEADQADTTAVHNNDHQETTEPQTIEKEERDLSLVEPSIDEPEETKTESYEEQHISVPNEQEAEQEAQQGRESGDRPPLHPVKVYYQDNEISLFPPREGDSSETFFLEDEGLAHESFGKLFESCREVLQNHINENEVLVMEIEALNLQLTEDSLEVNNVTLKLIVDVYLQLCRNDGVDEPEALYLTLSTKLTVAAELSDLLLAASEGKGLSEIQSWEVYPEAEDAPAELEDTAYAGEPRDALDNESNQGGSDDRALEPTSHDQDLPNVQQDNAEFQENRSSDNVEADDAAINVSEAEAQNAASPDPDSPHTPTHDSEEQKTDSTGTLEFLHPTDDPDERSEPGATDEHSFDTENNEDEYHEEAEAEAVEGAHPEEEYYVDDTGPTDGFEEPEGYDTADLTEEHPEEYHDLESESYDQPLSGDATADDAPHDNESVMAGKAQPQDTSEAVEPLFDGTSPTLQSLQTPLLVVDSLDMAEDLETLGNDSKADDRDSREPGEIDESVEQPSPSLANDEAPDLPFDDEADYFDLGITEGLGDFDEDHDTASPSHVSTKRSREVDDDLDIPESTSPEVKRSRSS